MRRIFAQAPRLAALAFWPTLLIVLAGELVPHPPTLDAPDKLLHFLAYFVLASLAATALGEGCKTLLAVIGLIILGGMLEIVQSFIGRDAEWLDEAANAAGAIMGGLGAILVLRLLRRAA